MSDPRLDDVLREVEVLKQRLAEVEHARRLRFRWLIAGVFVAATGAFAQLTVFTADSPALATQVNGNFNQLKTWLEQKIGATGTANVTVTGTTMLAGTTINGTVTPRVGLRLNGPLFLDFPDTTYDVWIQGGPIDTTGARNLAMLGQDEDSGDTLILNFAGEYSGGTRVESNLTVTGRLVANYDSGWQAVSSNNTYRFTHNFGAVPSHVELQACGGITGGAFGTCITRVVAATRGFNDGTACINPVGTSLEANDIFVDLNNCNAWGYWVYGQGFLYTGDADANARTAFYRVLAWR